MKYAKYIGWAFIGGFLAWILYIIAGLGSLWLSVGIVGFVGLSALFNRAIGKPTQKTGEPSTKRRVTSTDRDRWGGGTL
jgi:hypothetical protein